MTGRLRELWMSLTLPEDTMAVYRALKSCGGRVSNGTVADKLIADQPEIYPQGTTGSRYRELEFVRGELDTLVRLNAARKTTENSFGETITRYEVVK